MKKKKILVSWTGGLDSTYLVYKLLNEGHFVNTCYTKIVNNIDVTKREKQAISKMMIDFKQYNNYLGHLESESIGYNKNICFRQVLCILQGLINNYNNHDEVCIGYVMNDDIVSYLPDIIKIWNSYKSICHSIFPKLLFPLVKYSKKQIYDELPSRFLDNITYCERTEDNDEPCNKCRSCKRMRDLLEEVNFNNNVEDVLEEEPEILEVNENS